MNKIFIGTPAYSSSVMAQYATSLAETHTFLLSHGVQVQLQLNCSGSLLVAERNRLVQSFLDSDCTHMLFVDGDLGWPYQAVFAMLKKDVDFIGGLYPTRKDNTFLFRPDVNEDGSVKKSDSGLLKMLYIPAGFMLLKRAALEKMVAHFPELIFQPKDKSTPPSCCLFNTEVYEGEFWGEDYVFCRRATQAGIDIWVDPFIEFDHAGIRGMVTQVLTDKKEEVNV